MFILDWWRLVLAKGPVYVHKVAKDFRVTADDERAPDIVLLAASVVPFTLRFAFKRLERLHRNLPTLFATVLPVIPIVFIILYLIAFPESPMYMTVPRYLQAFFPKFMAPVNDFLFGAVPAAVGRLVLRPAAVCVVLNAFAVFTCVFGLLVAVTLLVTVWPVLLLCGACKIVISEMLKANSVGRLAMEEAQRLYLLSHKSDVLDNVLATSSRAAPLVGFNAILDELVSAWIDLIGGSVADLHRAQDLLRPLITRSLHSHDNVRLDTLEAAAAAVKSLASPHIARQSPPSTFRCGYTAATTALAAVFFTFLPSSRFGHLARPFSFNIFLPFIVPHPLPYLVKRCIMDGLSSWSKFNETASSSAALSAFIQKLYRFIDELQAASVSPNAIEVYIRDWLLKVEAYDVLPKANEELMEAILGAVVVWKTRKIDAARLSA